MKKTIITLAIVLITQILHAQNKYNLDMNWGTNVLFPEKDSIKNIKYKLGYQIGFDLEKRINNYLTLGLGIEYLVTNKKITDIPKYINTQNNLDTFFIMDNYKRCDYVQLPIYLKIKPIKSLTHFIPYLKFGFINTAFLYKKDKFKNIRKIHDPANNDYFNDLSYIIDGQTKTKETKFSEITDKYSICLFLSVGSSFKIKNKIAGLNFRIQTNPNSFKYNKTDIIVLANAFIGINF